MQTNEILDAAITIDGENLPTLRAIVEKHFNDAAGGNKAFGKMMAAQYLSLLPGTEPAPKPEPKPAPRPETCDDTSEPGTKGGQTASAGPEQKSEAPRSRMSSDGEAILSSLGVPLTSEGRVDVMAAFANIMTPEGSKTPLGTLVGSIMRSATDPTKPRS